MRSYRHLDTITAIFVAVLLISNIASTKIVAFGPFSFDGGTLLFPLAYIFGDILTEVYGYARSRRVIWLGFLAAALLAGVLSIVNYLPAAADWTGQAAFATILGQTPRIVAASLLAYFAGEFTNSFVLAKLKIFTAGKYLWMRTIGSTLIGEGLDTAIFCLVAFAGVFSNELLLAVIISNYIFKVGVEVLATPLTYAVVAWLKRAENEDYYDRKTNFNPFKIEI
ncbi:MAG: queuosine precursor transporter [Patescibacteria group bacterium]